MKKNTFYLTLVLLITGALAALPLQAASSSASPEAQATVATMHDKILEAHSQYADILKAGWAIVRSNNTEVELPTAFAAQTDPLLKMAIRMLCHQHYGVDIDDMPLLKILTQSDDRPQTTLDFNFIPTESVNRNEIMQMIIGFTCLIIDLRAARLERPRHMLIIKGLAGYNPTIISQHITDLIAQDNQLTSLAGLHMRALNNLRVSNNLLTSLDGVDVAALTWLDVRGNPIATADCSS